VHTAPPSIQPVTGSESPEKRLYSDRRMKAKHYHTSTCAGLPGDKIRDHSNPSGAHFHPKQHSSQEPLAKLV